MDVVEGLLAVGHMHHLVAQTAALQIAEDEVRMTFIILRQQDRECFDGHELSFHGMGL